ncbi:hypothetical protein [Aliagarivorans taiwanensis]|uniref:hypothetical protein n=1 Tax=Aliagarivorans taiwanensis TaxID=561966 RepID=UPI0012F99478|nr:hypothetical protein [Aliagarivorans taiwanensis]
MNCRKTLLALPFLALALCQSGFASATSDNYDPYVGLLIDYQLADQDMLGVTLAVSHFDRNFPRWGYYAGYARGKDEKIDHSDYDDYKIKNQMYRFGLSYSVHPRITAFGGPVLHQYSHHYRDKYTALCTDCEARSYHDKYKAWSGETGIRVNISDSVLLSASYNWAVDNVMLSIGFRN